MISKGKNTVHVGDYRGYTKSEIESKLDGKGLKVSYTDSQYSDKYDKGTVVTHSPMDADVAAGSTISVTLSEGPEPAKTANVPGSGDSVNEITNRGFTVGNITKEYSVTVAEGKIISCSPSGAQNLGTKIDVVVSLGVCTHPNVDANGKCSQCGKTGLTPTVTPSPSADPSPSAGDGTTQSAGSGGQAQ